MSETPLVLVADDDPEHREALADVAREAGCRVVSVSSGAEALECVSQETMDLVLLDLEMPEVDGITVLTELRKRHLLPGLLVVAVTEDVARSTRLDALAIGALEVLHKPIDRLELAHRLSTMIQLNRQREQTVRNMRSALHESEHRARLRFEQSPIAQVDWDLQFHVVDWNPAAERLFGLVRNDALGRPVNLIVPDSASDELYVHRRDLMEHGVHSCSMHTLTHADQSVRCEWHSNVILATEGTPLGLSSQIVDVSERDSLERQMRAAQRMEAVGRLAGGIAHDFNNVLSVIETYTGFVLSALPPDSGVREDVDIVRNAARRAAGLTRQLLAFSRRQVSLPEVLHLNRLLEDLGKMLRRLVGEDVTVETQLAENLWLVEVDPGQLEQVVLNLAINARDAMPSGGTLTIETKNLVVPRNFGKRHGVAVPPGPYVVLSVSDTGLGMDDDVQQRVFEPFFTTKEPGKGTGLGLSTVYGIVKQAGGFIWLDSKPGQGATFTIYFRRSHATKPSVRPQPKKTISLRGNETILVVEDDPDVRRAVTRILREAGYRPLVARDGKDALELAAKHSGKIDAMISDIVMPGLSGDETAARLAKTRPGLKTIYVSGHTNNDAIRRGDLGPDALFVQKPFAPSFLLAKLREALDKSNVGLEPEET